MVSNNYYIWLRQALGTGAHTERIFSCFTSPEEIFMSNEKSLRLSGVFSSSQIEKIKTTQIDDTYKILASCAEMKIDIITPDMSVYPEKLLETPDFPLVLYTRGDITCFKDKVPISIVGTRKSSAVSVRAATELASILSASGFLVVSGGALGIDSAAHVGAISSGGKTACVLGCGIGNRYLAENEPLRNAISENGVLISEYPPLAPPTKGSFPIRNRIIAGLSEGTVVIEAGVKSGSLITAKLANEMGRDVFAVPFDLLGSACTGTRELIRDGAKPVSKPFDILEEYLPLFPDKIIIDKNTDLMKDITSFVSKSDTKHIYNKIIENIQKTDACKKPEKRELPKDVSRAARMVYDSLDFKEKTANEIMAEVNLPTSDVFGALTELELLGFISFLPNTKYKIT